MFDDRPDPDALLRRVKQEEAQAGRGKLRTFFGFAPGVGKTYRMLQIARGLARQQKLDVVVGIVETHCRAETTSLIEGLEVLPRRLVEYRGHTLEEFDIDAALARRPALLLVDELAHSNVPGSRHAKRWQDVIELLDAGIDVLTTMNVQHVESLNDVIAQITGIQVRETVPDHVLDRADAIELVDIAPEELLQRLQEGKVYLPEQAKRAAEHFFQRGNLLALRELALRRTAQHVDQDVLEYREQHGVITTWPAGERILVCVGPAPSSGRLIRAAARMAAGMRCPWVAAYVESARFTMTAADSERLEAHLRLVESLGGGVARLSDVRVATAIMTYARRTNVTRIIVGKPTHARIRDRLRGSLLDEIVRGSGDIDVHVISGQGLSNTPERGSERTDSRPRSLHYGLAVLLVAITAGITALLRATLDLPDPEMLFLVAVILTAMTLGRGPAFVAAALSVACYDYFFVPPLYTFTIDDRRYVLTFATMFGVGFLVSELALRLKRQERDAVAREERTAVLYALSRELASADDLAQVANLVARHASAIFSARAAVYVSANSGDLEALGASPEDTALDERDRVVAQWSFEHGELAGHGTDTLPTAVSICAPLRSTHMIGVLALVPPRPTSLGAEQRAFLDAFCRQAAVALERVRLAAEARTSALRVKAEEMRSSLLSAVSHDLRTPLASITGAATSLRDDRALSDDTRDELVEAICDEAARLERLVANLLDMTRLQAGVVSLRRDWVPLEEIISSALAHSEDRLAHRKVSVQLALDLPLVFVDPVLLDQLFINLFENAAKYTPPDTSIDVVARPGGDSIVVEVIDHGPGLPPDREELVFQKFYRGSHAGIPGAGLGLPICRAIVEAHGGSIRAQQRPGAGAVFVITIPIGGTPPAVRQRQGNSP